MNLLTGIVKNKYSLVNKKRKSSDDDDNEESELKKIKFNPLELLTSLINNEDDDVYNIKNDIYFKTDITVESARKLVSIIDKLNKKIDDMKKDDGIETIIPSPIKLHITSNGGDLQMGCWLADVVEKSCIPIWTYIESYACSAASLVAVVGKRRFITKRSFIMIHQLSSWTSGKFQEIEDDYIYSKKLMNTIKDIYSNYTKLTAKQISDKLKHDTWIDSNACLQQGFVDFII